MNRKSDGDDPSTGSHFARDLEKSHYNDIREGRNVGGSTGSSRSVTDGDDPSTGSHFARDLKKNHYSVVRTLLNVSRLTADSLSYNLHLVYLTCRLSPCKSRPVDSSIEIFYLFYCSTLPTQLTGIIYFMITVHYLQCSYNT